ncbi:hypothetical protein [Cereibacter johrii]|uniref:DUF4435 domain-containing protein n=1 Tax=Cereibacter johrii TaxID=445629 RepID=A0ABX5J4R8_9RHOB|nr:hypothetical protein [Cereibacter johrii]PTM75886.1 hypothetical protein C8J29_110106 [Cereibacter johrii]
MISITAFMDERDIAQEVIMERMVHKGATLLLEGKTDIKRFKNFIDESACSLVNCQSVRKAEGAIKILIQRGAKGVLAILDRDFRSVLGLQEKNVNIVRSFGHDLDSDWLHTGATVRYLDEVADEAKVAALGGANQILNMIHTALRPISTARLLGVKRVFQFRTSGVDVSEFFDSGRDLLRDYLNSLTANGSVDASRHDWMEIEICKEMETPKPDLQMTNGHDLCCALGKMLMAEIGSRKRPQTWGSEIESHIRMSFDDRDFRSLAIYSKVLEWEGNNAGYRVLDKRLS